MLGELAKTKRIRFKYNLKAVFCELSLDYSTFRSFEKTYLQISIFFPLRVFKASKWDLDLSLNESQQNIATIVIDEHSVAVVSRIRCTLQLVEREMLRNKLTNSQSKANTSLLVGVFIAVQVQWHTSTHQCIVMQGILHIRSDLHVYIIYECTSSYYFSSNAALVESLNRIEARAQNNAKMDKASLINKFPLIRYSTYISQYIISWIF